MTSPPAALAEPSPVRAPWRRVAGVAFAFLFLNAMLSFNNWWPTPGVAADARLAPEFVWLWVALLGWLAWRRQLSARALTAFSAGYALLVLGRYADVTAPALFGRPINLYWDGREVPRFLWVSAQDMAWWKSAGAVAGVLLLSIGLYALLRRAIRVTVRDAVPYALRTRWVWVVTAAAAVLVSANHAGVKATWPFVSRPVIPTYWRQATLLAAAFMPQRWASVLPPSTALDASMAIVPGQGLAALRGRDVYLVMLETVGAVVYDNPRASAALSPTRQRFADDVRASGRHVATAFFTSPTFGGGSDLAQLGLLAGIDLSDPMRHDVLLTTQRPTLVSAFSRHGYRTFGLYPALSWEWPERAFYGFDVFIERRDLGYRGPSLGFWEVPDQFTAARFEQLHPRTVGQPPRFVFFPTITNHLPFSPVPPFQPDWPTVLTSQPFDAADTARALQAKPQWLDMVPDYLASVNYTYRWLGSWLRQPEPREAVFVLVGDHQPAANITGEGASWDVPVHIVTRDRALLERFVAQGFAWGMEPPRPTIGALHKLTDIMLDVFDGGDPRVAPSLPGGGAMVSAVALPGAALPAGGREVPGVLAVERP